MGKPNYVKLRTNLRLAINRLKLLEKKKAEQALKARREIADYIGNGKDDRARIRVEHIIREDYMVEGMEIVEMFCDLLLARFGLMEKMKEMDPGLEEAIATILWVSPRLDTDVQEMKEISKQLITKYGKEYNDSCVRNGLENVNEKVLVKMGLHAPPKLLIENYMIEIAKSYSVPFTPDTVIMAGEDDNSANDLIELGIPSNPGIGFEDIIANEKKDPRGPSGGSGGAGSSGGGGGGGGGMNYPNHHMQPPPFQPGSSGFYPGEAAPPYEAHAGGASGGPLQSPGGRLPPPLPSIPPNRGTSPSSGKGGDHNVDDSDIYSYALTPEQRRPPSYSAYNNQQGNTAGQPSGFSNNLYNDRESTNDDVIRGMSGGASNQMPPTFQGYPGGSCGAGAGGMRYPGDSGSHGMSQPLPPGMGGPAPSSGPVCGDDIYVPVLPDVPNLPGENIQSGKHNTDYINSQFPAPPGGAPNHMQPGGIPVLPDIPTSFNGLPDVPTDSVRTDAGNSGEDVDFDDLTKRFEALKKKK